MGARKRGRGGLGVVGTPNSQEKFMIGLDEVKTNFGRQWNI